MNLENIGIVAAILLIIAAIIFGPLMSIWALNTLFSLNIAYTFWTWLAMVWTGLFFSGVKYNRK